MSDARSVIGKSLYIPDYGEYWNAAPAGQKCRDENGVAYSSTVGFKVVELAAADYLFEVIMVVRLEQEHGQEK